MKWSLRLGFRMLESVIKLFSLVKIRFSVFPRMCVGPSTNCSRSWEKTQFRKDLCKAFCPEEVRTLQKFQSKSGKLKSPVTRHVCLSRETRMDVLQQIIKRGYRIFGQWRWYIQTITQPDLCLEPSIKTPYFQRKKWLIKLDLSMTKVWWQRI